MLSPTPNTEILWKHNKEIWDLGVPVPSIHLESSGIKSAVWEWVIFLWGWICLLWQTQATGLQVELHERKREGRVRGKIRCCPQRNRQGKTQWKQKKMVHDPRGFAWKRSAMWTHSASLIPQESEKTTNVLGQPRVGCKRNETWSLRSWQSGSGCSLTGDELQKTVSLRDETEMQAKTWFLRSERGY